MLLVGGLSLPFDKQTTTLVKKFVSSAIRKIYILLTEKLRVLEATVVEKLTFFTITFICKI